jgi:hypothetical protein
MSAFFMRDLIESMAVKMVPSVASSLAYDRKIDLTLAKVSPSFLDASFIFTLFILRVWNLFNVSPKLVM